ncbi:unnamed protein product [Chilo suppressalis]|uniref:CUB domain-containing protein n=1 Tax=Chilo suppressalis TaxID=168631 RepID=A0ABN8B4X3_CHISP|nr:unnamed protein product [Chilo suppressalis]
MTSPALVVLFLALVYSTIGTTSEQTADHDSKPTDKLAIYPNNLVIYPKNNAKLNMGTARTNVNNNKINNKFLNDNTIAKDVRKVEFNNVDSGIFDEIYTEEKENLLISNLEIHKANLKEIARAKMLRKREEKTRMVPRYDGYRTMRYFDEIERDNRKRFDRSKYTKPRRRVKRDDDPCESFMFSNPDQKQITHPIRKDNSSSNNYARGVDCYTVIKGPDGTVIELTFVDVFHIEHHPDCAYDYLQIRDGLKGYADEIKTLCGHTFPRQIVTTGPYAWLKFHSDDTIEYEGFRINIAFRQEPKSRKIPKDCYNEEEGNMNGFIGIDKIKDSCKEESKDQPLDVLWTIRTPENTKIYLNFTKYFLKKPNECEENVIQVFGSELEYSARLAHYCGSVANSVTTKDSEGGKGKDKGNLMYVRFFASMTAKDSQFNASYTAFRTLDPNKDEKCDEDEEFDCEDNTCIALNLRCDGYAHCRLKADEDVDLCKGQAESMISQPHIMVILIIFSLILSGMSFVFFFKCIRKLYQDHKLIKKHITESCEDRLDNLISSRLTLDAKRLQRDSERGVSLERENHSNEIKRQRSYSKHKPSSIDSDFIPEVTLDSEESWNRDANTGPVVTENVRIEHNGRPRKSDTSKREESLRSKTKENEEIKERKEIRDVSVGAPDTKESGCQTRESLFQTETAPSSDGSGSNGPVFSTFGYSGATIVRPSPPPQTNTSEITIELLSQVPQHPAGTKSQKKLSERRPMSTETTRSAPDVIIVSKPIR